MSAESLRFAQYFYRSNLDGTVDSICGLCFWTVATAKTFAQLKPSENAHRCHRKTVAAGPDHAA
jgi:hypothetical protein